MDETVVNVYLFLFILFFFQFHSNGLGSFLIVWWRRNSILGSGLLWGSFFFVFTLRENRKRQKRLGMRLWKKLKNVCVFVMTAISTWMNGNLHEPTREMSANMSGVWPTALFDDVQVILYLIREQDSITCRPINTSKGHQGRCTQSLCIFFFSLGCHVAVFVSILTQ